MGTSSHGLVFVVGPRQSKDSLGQQGVGGVGDLALATVITINISNYRYLIDFTSYGSSYSTVACTPYYDYDIITVLWYENNRKIRSPRWFSW